MDIFDISIYGKKDIKRKYGISSKVEEDNCIVSGLILFIKIRKRLSLNS